MNTSRKIRFGIQQKLFLIVLAALVANILLLLVLGSTTFERLYISNKVQELKSGAQKIQAAYGLGAEEYAATLQEVENRNTVLRVFHMDSTGELVVDYFTRMGFFPNPEDDRNYRFARESILEFFSGELPERLRNEDYVVLYPSDSPQDAGPPKEQTSQADAGQEPDGQGNAQGAAAGQAAAEETPQSKIKNEKHWRNSIVLYARLSDSVFMSLDTPREFIAESAELAVKSCAAISLITLTLAAAALYFVCRRITAPIKEIQQTADGIAAMDFSRRCGLTSRDELGHLAQAVNNMSDSLQANIGKLEEANTRLRDDLHQQEQQDQMRKRFIANVSHDFKTPLTLITSYADSLRELDGTQAELRDEYCDIIRSEGYKMTRLVQMLLNLTRLESGMVQIAPMPFAISEAIDGVVRSHALLAQKRGLTVECRVDEALIVHADFQRIVQVVTNLYENAMKYTPENGRVWVNAERGGTSCLVSVRNTGETIPPEDMERLFISFYRTDRARGGEDGQSYGLGLAIVRSILELHGQEYGVRNITGGVEFWFRLALADLGDDEMDDENGSGSALPEKKTASVK